MTDIPNDNINHSVIRLMDAIFGQLLISVLQVDIKRMREILDEILTKRHGLFSILKEEGKINDINSWIQYLKQALIIHSSYDRKDELEKLIGDLEDLVAIEYITDITQEETNHILS